MTDEQPEVLDDEVEYYVPVAWQAIVSLVVGIVTVLFALRLGGLGIVAMAFGADALWRTNRGLRTGKGMAIAGVVLGAVAPWAGWGLALVVALGVAVWFTRRVLAAAELDRTTNRYAPDPPRRPDHPAPEHLNLG